MQEPFYNAALTFNPQKTVVEFTNLVGDRRGQRIYLAPSTDTELNRQWSEARGIVAMRRRLRMMNTLVTFALAFGFMIGVTVFDPGIDESVTTNAMNLALIQVGTPLLLVIMIGIAYAVLTVMIAEFLLPQSKTMPRFDDLHEVPKDIGAVLFSRLTVEDHRKVIEIEDPLVLTEALGLLAERYSREATREKEEQMVAREEEKARLRDKAQQHLDKA